MYLSSCINNCFKMTTNASFMQCYYIYTPEFHIYLLRLILELSIFENFLGKIYNKQCAKFKKKTKLQKQSFKQVFSNKVAQTTKFNDYGVTLVLPKTLVPHILQLNKQLSEKIFMLNLLRSAQTGGP